MRMRIVVAAAVALGLAGAGLLAAGALTRSSGSDAPVSATPDPDQPARPASALHEIRLAAARALRSEPLATELAALRHAGFDGCLGYYVQGKACTEQFMAGYVAIFAAGNGEARFHAGGGRFIGPLDPKKGRVDDGSPVPPELEADFGALLAEYARQDLALRLKRAAADIAITAIVPIEFPNSCLGWEVPGMRFCAEVITPGFVILAEGDGKAYRYHAAGSGVVATSFVPGKATAEPATELVALQRAMRDDLARRAGRPLAGTAVQSYRAVTWPDGCLGVHREGEVCTQALVEGFLALLREGGREYRYHGTGTRFIAASFETGAKIGEPAR